MPTTEGTQVTLRPVEQGDLELMLAWRSLPSISETTQVQGNRALAWEEHWNWWNGRTNRMDWLILYEGRRVGVVSLKNLSRFATPEISVYIGEQMLWGKGIGKQALREALDWLRDHHILGCRATIRPDNQRSIHLFESLGFVERNSQHYELGIT